MLVDDDAVLREAIRQALVGALPCPVIAVGDGPSALAYVAHTQPCLAVLDVDMAPISGLELARALRKQIPELPLMFLTGSNHLDLADEFAAVGAVANLRKPVRTQELVAACEKHRLRD